MTGLRRSLLVDVTGKKISFWELKSNAKRKRLKASVQTVAIISSVISDDYGRDPCDNHGNLGSLLMCVCVCENLAIHSTGCAICSGLIKLMCVCVSV